jgi:hypothetical protein
MHASAESINHSHVNHSAQDSGLRSDLSSPSPIVCVSLRPIVLHQHANLHEKLPAILQADLPPPKNSVPS